MQAGVLLFSKIQLQLDSNLLESPSEYCRIIWYGKNGMVGLKCLRICSLALIQYTNVTDDRQRDRHCMMA